MITLPTLSVRQPWPWAMFHAGKDIENRTWWTAKRGTVLIHAGKVLDGRREDVQDMIEDWAISAGVEVPNVDDLPLGGIVGAVDIVDCVKASSSDWFFGPYGLVLANPRPLPFFACKGRLSFFTVDYPFEVPQ